MDPLVTVLALESVREALVDLEFGHTHTAKQILKAIENFLEEVGRARQAH